MTETIIIDADQLDLVAKELKIPAATVRDSVAAFNKNSAPLGAPWGNDELGKEWAEIYVPGVESVQASFKAIVDGLSKLSDDFVKMGRIYRHVEEGNSR
ncbi:hypothetical protein ACH4OY_11190 [Micromonospora rubida]|uniref:WXG100 family type VII secretion target n=1 Tax=Micromonospora rubida TaxID=2697657 RepID=A0ABW7SHS5_9ACTN